MRRAENLRVVEFAMQIAELTYSATRAFPADERFGLVSQMRRAAVSIGSNIAEGCGRSSAAQFAHFIQMASRISIRVGVPSTLVSKIGLWRRGRTDQASLVDPERTPHAGKIG